MIFTLLFSFCGCAKVDANQNSSSNTKVVINLPDDDTVNGYRNEKEEIPKEKAQYCANKNSKIFHNHNCPSVDKMKSENRYFTNNKDELLKEGYSPCKSCEP